jgi:hypothetical protein
VDVGHRACERRLRREAEPERRRRDVAVARRGEGARRGGRGEDARADEVRREIR